MNQQQRPQMPPNQPQQSSGQVPDHRLAELENRLRQAELQNTQLRTTVDFMRQGQQNPQQAPQQQAFKPEVADAIKSLVNERLAPMETQHKQQIGYLVDQLDQAKYQLNYGAEKFQPYQDKVEQIRQQEIARGNFVPREDILRMVHFEETGKKNVIPQAPAPDAAAKPPVFDPFFGTYVDPATGKPVQQNQTFAPEQQEQPDPNQAPQQMPQQQTQPQQMPWQQPQQVQQQPAQQFQQNQPGARQPMQTNHPNGNAYGQNFGLPGQGVNSANTQGQPNPRAPLNLETATEADLQAFENSFGEIPL